METGRGIVGHPMASPGGVPAVISQLKSMAGSTRTQLSHLQSSHMSDLTGGSLQSVGRESLQRYFSFPGMNMSSINVRTTDAIGLKWNGHAIR
jgi:hypothetical protein